MKHISFTNGLFAYINNVLTEGKYKNMLERVNKERYQRSYRVKEHNTKEKILDSAKYLFANKGLKETSVRDITSHAGVHLAAVNYHFQTKDGLLKDLIDRKMVPLNRHRIELLDIYEKQFGKDSVPIEYALYALIAPEIEMYFEDPDFLRIVGQIASHPDRDTYNIFITNFKRVFSRFKEVLSVSLPHLSAEDLMWRMHFLTGSMIYTSTSHAGLTSLSEGLCRLDDRQEIVDKLIAFSAAGLRAKTYKHQEKEDE